MPTSTAAATAPAPSDLAWRVIGLANLYRLLVPPLLLASQWLTTADFMQRLRHPDPLVLACVAYLAFGVLMVLGRRLPWPSLRVIALVNAAVDAVGISLILYASGGVASGLGILLVLPVGAMAILAGSRDAFLIASTAALGVLTQQIAAHVAGEAAASDYTTAGVLGAVLFVIALSVWPIANRLRESEALVRRQEVDLANLAQLSQYIVQHLRESILVIDTHDRIRLINESAALILGDRAAYPGALVGEVSPRLLYLLEAWHRSSSPQSSDLDRTFVSADGTRVVRPHFAPLGDAAEGTPILVFLEDTSMIEEKVQQSKLAALGRLSASIAHEIRNPVGAMSHAGQLLAESPALTEEDRHLTEIIRKNAMRVSTIINNVLQLSRREETKLERMQLRPFIDEFREEFCATMQWQPQRLDVTAAAEAGTVEDLEVRADPSQLRQVIWNLCDNAIKHAVRDRADDLIEIRYGRLSATARPFLEVSDRGPGVAPENAERIFEPFFSGERRSTGLGLYLARELAQTSGATLLYEPRLGGGSTFRLVFADPQRWEIR
jgi:two-component system, NtrC family, sensor histidine kinase PilS